MIDRADEVAVLPTRSRAWATMRYVCPSTSGVVSRVAPKLESAVSLSVPTSVPNAPVSEGSQPACAVASHRKKETSRRPAPASEAVAVSGSVAPATTLPSAGPLSVELGAVPSPTTEAPAGGDVVPPST